MLSAVRNAVKSPIAMVIVVLLVASFALWGVNDIFQAPGNAITVVGGERVTVAELQLNFERRMQRERQENPSLTNEQARQQGMGDEVLGQLILNAMLRSQARSLGITASDAAVRDEISSIEFLTDPLTGGFDRMAYNNYLAQVGQRQRQFESEVRNDLVLSQMTSSLFEGIAQPDIYRSILLRYIGETRDLEAVVISPAAAGEIGDPTSEDLQATIDNNPQFFTTPERRAFTLVRLRPEDYLTEVEIEETDIVEQYEYEVSTGSIGTPAMRTYTQLVFDDEAAARDAALRLGNDEDPTIIATELGASEPSRLEDRQAFQVPDSAVRDALFEATTGDAFAVETRFGNWFAIVVEAAVEDDIPTLEERRQEIRDALAQTAAEDLLYADLGEYEEARGNGFSLEEAAFAAGLPYEIFQPVDEQGRSEDGDFAFWFFTEPEIGADIFSRPAHIDGELQSYGEGSYFAVRVDEIIEARVRSLEEAREDAESVWRLQEVDTRLEDIAENVMELAESGQSLQSIADANPDFRLEQASLRRTETSGTFGQQVVSLVFSMDVGDFEATRSASARSHMVIRVADAHDGDVEDPQLLAQIETFLTDGYRGDIDSSLVSALYREFDFTTADIETDLRDQALGVVDQSQFQ
ncbi:SurA N-terminal domain-containing protein [Hyphobacterium sp. HN65]|uniref:SurA N-terminal domain-containing protein n=1 Tax=Hyphobacterium lacteum TaxID=3116575 RepID=A0ABU7LLZ6_9PROT|nr:SurA N-terminal domain-containing protein [Hyphobacterium sp. HN65]MEE2524912.1 SurA N-terminal domain-containing protein [Hyphobacterium sp. HN65]